MTISATNQGLKPGVVTSSNRPANPYDGMMIYETDTNLVRIWNGTAWKTLAYSDYTSGTVLQTVSATTATQVSTTSSTPVDTGLSVSITPTASTSKILLLISHAIYIGTAGSVCTSWLLRGSTQIGKAIANDDSGNNQHQTSVITYLDSPATTSTTTYKTQFATSANTSYLSNASTTSTLLAMEVVA
ncbi:MAG: hypothetical protein EB164_09275 [Thaumarchaeota archaeon]|nr:hypothetical protein [Nitrososphaerota archaeon]NDB91023.1 hypothetical protein [Nitrososphaerota archaeon]